MPKPTSKNKPDLKNSKVKTYSWVAGIILLAYVIGLVNPITGNYLKYPYYELFCGQKPVVASDFMARTYLTPDMKSYKVKNMGATLYCTENDAKANGYRRSEAQ